MQNINISVFQDNTHSYGKHGEKYSVFGEFVKSLALIQTNQFSCAYLRKIEHMAFHTNSLWMPSNLETFSLLPMKNFSVLCTECMYTISQTKNNLQHLIETDVLMHTFDDVSKALVWWVRAHSQEYRWKSEEILFSCPKWSKLQRIWRFTFCSCQMYPSRVRLNHKILLSSTAAFTFHSPAVSNAGHGAYQNQMLDSGESLLHEESAGRGVVFCRGKAGINKNTWLFPVLSQRKTLNSLLCGSAGKAVMVCVSNSACVAEGILGLGHWGQTWFELLTRF